MITALDTHDIDSFLGCLRQCFRANRMKPINGFDGIADFILKRGQRFTTHRPGPVERGTLGQCFRNAALAALYDDDLIYCEGYASSIIPCEHAWCVTRSGLVVDPTWDDGQAYLGVPVKTGFLERHLRQSKHYGLLGLRASPLYHLDEAEWRETIKP